jgi:hypothetical protein
MMGPVRPLSGTMGGDMAARAALCRASLKVRITGPVLAHVWLWRAFYRPACAFFVPQLSRQPSSSPSTSGNNITRTTISYHDTSQVCSARRAPLDQTRDCRVGTVQNWDGGPVRSHAGLTSTCTFSLHLRVCLNRTCFPEVELPSPLMCVPSGVSS